MHRLLQQNLLLRDRIRPVWKTQGLPPTELRALHPSQGQRVSYKDSAHAHPQREGLHAHTVWTSIETKVVVFVAKHTILSTIRPLREPFLYCKLLSGGPAFCA